MVICIPIVASGQALSTASRKADLSFFGEVAAVNPNYGPSSQEGYVFGIDYTRFLSHSYLVPSLELRTSVSPKGATAGEYVYGGGLKLEHRYGRFHPYGDFLFGVGFIRFRDPHGFTPSGDLYLMDLSNVYTYGGGFDVDVTKRWAVKVDAQSSRWKLDSQTPITLEPSILGIGLTYHPFRPK